MVIEDAAYSEDYVEYIIEYNGDRKALMELYRPYGLSIIDNRYAVAYQIKPEDYMESFSRLEYNLFPKVYTAGEYTWTDWEWGVAGNS